MARLMDGQGRLARLGIGTQVVLSGALALAAVLMVNWLAGRPGMRQRYDLTESSQNTLSTATMGVLSRLPGEVTVDTFLPDIEHPILRQVSLMAWERSSRLLALYEDLAGERVRVRHNDMSNTAAVQERMRELRLRGLEPCLVLSYEGAREVVLLNGDLATFDPGQPNPQLPNPRPPRILEFRGERAITQALLKVTRGEELAVYFTTGHQELEIPDTGEFGLDELHGMLMEEGLRVGRWNPNEDGPLPEDCACLVLLDPKDALADGTIEQVVAYVERGGRLVVAPPANDEALERSRLADVLEPFQLEVLPGWVCQPRPHPTTGRPIYGAQEVALFPIHPNNMRRHPLVEPFRASGRTFYMSGAHPVRVAGQPRQGVSSPLFQSEVAAWVDALPYDFTPAPGEAQGRQFELAAASQFRPEGLETEGALQEQAQARIVVIGSSFAFANAIFETNYDFLRNVFNWALDREYRLSMSPRDPDLRRWPEDKLENLPALGRLAWLWIPALCFGLGVLFAYLRARGGPRATSAAS